MSVEASDSLSEEESELSSDSVGASASEFASSWVLACFLDLEHEVFRDWEEEACSLDFLSAGFKYFVISRISVVFSAVERELWMLLDCLFLTMVLAWYQLPKAALAPCRHHAAMAALRLWGL